MAANRPANGLILPMPGWTREPRVFVLEFYKLAAFALERVRVVEVVYTGGGLEALFTQIVAAADIEGLDMPPHPQALLEAIYDLAQEQALRVHVRHADRLAREDGPGLLSFAGFWQQFALNGGEDTPMFLALDYGDSSASG